MLSRMGTRIESPQSDILQELCQRLRELAPALDKPNAWPAEQLRLCGEYGVFEWFLSREAGGQGWSEADVMRGYLELSSACLTTTFVITQRTGACRRIEACDNEGLKAKLLPDLVAGKSFATVGISHLTTSRRHLAKPVLRAEETADGFMIDGFSPWVTGGPFADHVLIGAALDDERQILAVLPMDSPGVSVPPVAELVGLSASHTGPVQCDRVTLGREWLVAGPIEDVMKHGVGARPGGFQTSALAIGLAGGAVRFLQEEAAKRPDLLAATDALHAEWHELRSDLLSAAADEPVCSTENLRTRSNSLALRSSQAALAAAKGTGYVVGHPAGRWCREALFFLVWSCPQPVMAANLCELAGISD
ncbi:MAG: acyl-CoA/acyl-ACP dehydrogenase [Planctomycetaceae bacterium]|nr:acyl-CoA/acyl-ACP dehydrogenase [Planctomycetaceae bacterium]MCB9939156.1 acyl-CoA/acyl-ACP dehydrogenase [Planctomycetaceae bacterium]